MGLKMVVLVGSVRSDRQGIKAARFVDRVLTMRGHEVTVVDPAALKLPLLDRMYKRYPKGEAPEPLESLAALYRSADAFVVVSGEYNHSIPPALSNLLDYFLEEYLWRPSAIVCYSTGAFGGVRAAMQLRAMLCELGMPSISSLFPIPKIQDVFDDAGNARDAAIDRRFARFASELEWYAAALAEGRARGVTVLTSDVRDSQRRDEHGGDRRNLHASDRWRLRTRSRSCPRGGRRRFAMPLPTHISVSQLRRQGAGQHR